MDPLVMYLVLPTSLNMDVGKVGVTCGHAVQLLMVEYWNRRERREGSDHDQCQLFLEWLNDKNYRKVTLAANEIEFAEAKKLGNNIVVVDHGYTEVPAQSETCVGFWPMLKSQRPSLLANLKPLRSKPR